MKAVKGIKALCITAIALNAGFLVYFLVMIVFILHTVPHGSDLISFLAVLFAFFICALYPVQLLLIRRTYYRHRPITSVVKTFLHISRVIQILFSCLATVVFVVGLLEVINNLRHAESITRYLLIQGSLLLFIAITITINTTIFFKGWRLLKLVRHSNYIEEVMSSFD